MSEPAKAQTCRSAISVGASISNLWVCPHRWLARITAILGLGVIVASTAHGISAERPAVSPNTAQAKDWVFLSDDAAREHDAGCDAVSVIDVRTGAMLAHGSCDYSPGQLAVTSDGSLVASLGHPDSFLHVLRRIPSGGAQWTGQFLRDERRPRRWAKSGAIAFTPDDSTAIIATYGGLETYEIASLAREVRAEPSAVYRFSDPSTTAAEIEVSADSATAYIVATDGLVYFLRVGDMSLVHDPLPYKPPSKNREYLVRRTYTTLDPSGRYLVINTADQDGGSLNVLDLVRGSTQIVHMPAIRESWGVRFNYARTDEGLLAVHGRTEVAVYRMDPITAPMLLATARVPAPSIRAFVDSVGRNGEKGARIAALAWSGSGDAVIAGLGLPSRKEWRVLELRDGPPVRLAKRLDFDSCTWVDDPPRFLPQGYDVMTLNRPLNPPRPSPTPTTAPTLTPVVTSTPPSTPTVVPSPTNTEVPRTTTTPSRLYIPILLKEECDPTQLQADVALVIDASTSMLEETREKRTKLSAALEAVELFLGELNLPLDQAAVVQFNGDVELLQGLTGDRSALVDSLNRIQVKRQTRIDLGIQVAREELKSSRRRVGNQAVMIVLTDGRANPVGPDAAVREAEAAKSDNVTIFTIGLGEDLNLAALEAMASKPSYFYRAPDGEDLKEIYAAIAVEIPCPAADFWGRR